MAFDSRFSMMRRTLPRSARSIKSSTFTSSRTRCETTVSCWLSRTCLTSGRRRNSERSRPDALLLPGAEGQQVFDEPVQLDAVVTQDGDDLALGVVQGSDRAVHEQFRAFADVGERRLQLVRHVAQEAVAFLRQIEQAQAQPFELRAQALEVARARHFDGTRERAAAELADGAVDGAQRPADRQREREDGDERERRQQGGLPEQAPLRARGLRCSSARRASIWRLPLSAMESARSLSRSMRARMVANAVLPGGVELTALAISLCMRREVFEAAGASVLR